MSVAELLPLPVVIPIGSAILAPLVTKIHRRLPLIIGIGAMLGSLALLLVVATRVYSGNGQVLTHYFSAEKPVRGQVLGIAFAADPFGLTFALLAAGLGLLLLVSLLSEFGDIGERELGGLACLSQLLLAALIASALTADTVNLFVWFQVAALSSYGLTGFFLERPIALEAAFKIVVLTTIGSFAVFIGAAMLYAKNGALNFGQLHNTLDGEVSRPAIVALALLVAGFATKSGIAPFHGWLPDAHTPVPGAISALFSGLMVNLGIVAIVRLALQVYGRHSGHAILGLITGLGVGSALLGALMALAQDDLKRLLAWDTVSQMGVLLVGFASATAEGVAGATFHLVNHGLFKALLFLGAGAIVHATGVTRLSEMGGLARLRPITTAAFTVGAMSIAGVPGFNGYASLQLIHEGLHHQPAILVLALVAQVITVAALARAAYLGFYRRRAEPYQHLEAQHAGMRLSLITLGTACVALGVPPYLVVHEVARPAASILLNPAAYASGVLAGSGAVPPIALPFAYGKPGDLILTAVEIALGLLLAAAYLRIREPRPISLLRRLHTGSVNDYAAFAATGLAICAFVLIG
ncbi:MAG: Fe-S-binding protein [Pseudonocardiales bacterium]|nr:Fe-S-binding protein [Pseudonocardiales bacterium]